MLEGWQTRRRVCSLGGFSFRRPWVLKLGTCASLSKVNKTDTTEQLIEDGVIGFGGERKRLSGG
jgi:hypothetical protein